MSRTLMALLALGLLAGCGSKQKKEDGVLGEKTLEAAMGIDEEDKQGPATEFVEPDGCVVEIRKEAVQGDNQQYMQATEGAIVQSRMAFGSMCGSALPVEINWPDVFLSAGFDAGEAPGAVGSASETFLRATKPVCDGAPGENWRAKVKHVILTPTDQADRVGLCFEEGEGVLVYRFMLTPGDATSSAPEAEAITGWYAENL